jgi:hypothetical protein
MIVHDLWAGSPVVTHIGCCPSAAPTASTPDLRDHNLIRLASSQLLELDGQRPAVPLSPLVTIDDR